MSETLDFQQSDDRPDIDEARKMAYASRQNEENRLAYEAIANAHDDHPERSLSPLRAHMLTTVGAEWDPDDPRWRIVKVNDPSGFSRPGEYFTHTAESARIEAQKERAEADRKAQEASENFKANN